MKPWRPNGLQYRVVSAVTVTVVTVIFFAWLRPSQLENFLHLSSRPLQLTSSTDRFPWLNSNATWYERTWSWKTCMLRWYVLIFMTRNAAKADCSTHPIFPKITESRIIFHWHRQWRTRLLRSLYHCRISRYSLLLIVRRSRNVLLPWPAERYR